MGTTAWKVRRYTLFSAGGHDNPDLPPDSRYRGVTPMGMTIRHSGTDVRGVRWGPLQVLLGDATTVAGRHVFSYVYATSMLPVGEPAGKAAGLQTAIGVGLGSSLADLKASYPAVQISDDAYGPTFATSGSGELSGTLSGTGSDGFVTSIIGGKYCGE